MLYEIQMIRHISSKHIFRKPLSGNKSAENNNLHSLSPIKLCYINGIIATSTLIFNAAFS